MNDEEEGIFRIGTELNDTIIHQILGANSLFFRIISNQLNK